MISTQSFEHPTRKLLRAQAVNVQCMVRRKDLNEIVAYNLGYFMGRHQLYKNPNSLGKAAEVAPNSIRNLLDPKKRTVTTGKPVGYPTLDTLQKIALKLGCEVWQLLHPEIEKSIRQQEMYLQIEKNYKHLTTEVT